MASSRLWQVKKGFAVFTTLSISLSKFKLLSKKTPRFLTVEIPGFPDVMYSVFLSFKWRTFWLSHCLVSETNRKLPERYWLKNLNNFFRFRWHLILTEGRRKRVFPFARTGRKWLREVGCVDWLKTNPYQESSRQPAGTKSARKQTLCSSSLRWFVWWTTKHTPGFRITRITGRTICFVHLDLENRGLSSTTGSKDQLVSTYRDI